MDKVQFCPVCKEKGMPPRCPGYWILSEEEPSDSCYYDGCRNTIVYNISSEDFHVIFNISEDVKFIHAMIDLKENDIIEYNLKMSQFRNQVGQQKAASEVANKNTVKCPKCGSTNIQIVPRKWSLLTGFLTNKTDRVCVNCKHKF